MILDPICGMHMDPEKAPAMATYNEHTFYFCCDEHKEQFEQNPEQWIDKAGEEYQMHNNQQKAA
jgi:YHS domain-containing protein